MSNKNYFFDKKGEAFIQRPNREPELIQIDKEKFREIAEKIVKENPECEDLNIIVQKAMTVYTKGARITKRTATRYSSGWIALKDIVRTLTENQEEV